MAVFRPNGFNTRAPELFILPLFCYWKRVSHWRVKLCKTLTMAAGNPVHDEPPDVQHAGVVVDVQKRDLVIVLS